RGRPVEENLRLLEEMKAGKFKDGECVLRARIDMAHPNVLMRDPLLYRIRHAHHHRQGDAWCIYPMYDFAHPLEDAFEGITHSICTLEFETNRELYDWVLDNLGPWEVRPRQYEFARLSLDYTVMSKRKLLQLVTEKHVSGWDDPRMPTVAGMRRRGVRPFALKDFAELIGVAKNNSTVDIGKFEFAVRQDLEGSALRGMAVLDPLPVTVTNWPADTLEQLEVTWWPGEPARAGTRQVPFGRELLIEREDFAEAPPADWKRLAPGREVRLVGAYVLRCERPVKDAAGRVQSLECTVDLASRGGNPADGRKLFGTLHWVHATASVPAEVRLYDRLFQVAQPDAEGDFLKHLNPGSLVHAPAARVEPALAAAAPGRHFQFLRLGYFFSDPQEHSSTRAVFNRTLTLKDTWARPAEARPADPKPEKEKPAQKAGAPRKGRAEHRAEARAANPRLAAAHASLQQKGLSEEEADLVSAGEAQAGFVDAALASGAPARSVARWFLNDLLGLLGDRAPGSTPLTGPAFGQFVSLAEERKLPAGAARALLSALVEQGGAPADRLSALGLDKGVEASAVDAALGRVFQAHAAEVSRFRAGEKKLFGVLLGAALRELGAAADPAAVRQALTAKIG
ncbi:MAG: glutamine--tRNA ligase/YqeY domain fusion protein, partial [Deltaproteobacteria bacterium]|nr:glutamine--tRNA ligase/YqeY domain fusion protein [Deltaproteobacteria bacterium]